MRIGLAFQTFFKILGNRDYAQQIGGIGKLPAPSTGKTAKKSKAAPAPESAPGRSDALTLLASLQRDARFLDFFMEGLEGYEDADVGAAARDVHRETGKVLKRLFDLAPLRSEEVESELTIPAGTDATRTRLTGDVSGDGPWTGTLQHPGWIAGSCKIPEWTGKKDDRLIIAAAEVEVG